MKTFGINDFYFGEPDYPYPWGASSRWARSRRK